MTAQIKKRESVERSNPAAPRGHLKRQASAQSLVANAKQVSAEKAVVSHIGEEAGSHPLGQLRAKTTAQVNQAIELVRGTHDDVMAALDVVKRERKLAKRLKDAVDDGSIRQEQGMQLRFDMAAVRRERTVLAETIERNNRARTLMGPQTIRLGKKVLAEIAPAQVPFTRPGEQRALGSSAGLSLLETKLELEELVLTRRAKGLVSDLRQVNQARIDARGYLNGLDDADPIQKPKRPESADDALRIAERTAAKLLRAGGSASGIHTLDPETALYLLSS